MTTLTTIDAGTYGTDPIHSNVQVGVRHMGVGAYRTSFHDVDARLTAGADGLRIEGGVRADSIAIHNPPEFREHVVNGGDFLDAANHPEIAFSSSRLELRADGTLELEGELVIKGIARPISATGTWRPPTADMRGNLRTALDLTTVVDRRQWDVTWQAPLPGGGDALGWDVTLDVQLELVRDGD